MKEIKEFNFDSFPFTVLEKEGEYWFVAKEVCEILAISNHRDAVSNLDEDEKGVAKTDTLGGEQDTLIISESGLYTLIIRSNKPKAKEFRKWVTSVVLPNIRKTGSYIIGQEDNKPIEMQNILFQMLERQENLFLKVIEMQSDIIALSCTGRDKKVEYIPEKLSEEILLLNSQNVSYRKIAGRLGISLDKVLYVIKAGKVGEQCE